MISLQVRSYEKELLDREDIPFKDIQVNLTELNVINTLLGGHKITCRGLSYFLKKLPSGATPVIAEIGSGGGDNLVAIEKFLNKKNKKASLIGVDIKLQCIEFARQQYPQNRTWILSDYKKTPWPHGKPDIIFSSLFCHHFTDDEMIEQLAWLKANSRVGFFINDLHRNAFAYYSIKWLTRIFSNSYLAKNDGPLSVKRSFRKEDWIRLLSAAGISNYSIRWQWAFRYLICVPNEQ